MNHRISCAIAFVLLTCVAACNSPAKAGITPDPRLSSTTPWNLAALSVAPAFEWVDATSPVRSLKYHGLEYQGKPTSVFAYYATPGTLSGDTSKDQNLPAVVLIHGGGGTAFREWVELWAKRGYAAISMDLAGSQPNEGQNPHDPKNRTRLPDGGPGQSDWENKFGNIDQPQTEHWPYHAVANSILAHSLIRSFPEVDASRTAVTGISWGGYLTCIVSSLDNRFKAAVPVYGCGFLHENSAWLPIFAKMSPEQKAKWVELYDPSRYLPACRVPIFFVNGTNDFAYPLDSYMKSYQAVPKETSKNIRVTVNMPHSHPAGWEPKEIGMFVDQYLMGSARLNEVRFVPCNQAGQSAHAIFKVIAHGNRKDTDPARPVSASLHYTTETTPINKRQWTTSPATIDAAEKHGVRIDSIPADATAWFITVTDESSATVSGEVHVVK